MIQTIVPDLPSSAISSLFFAWTSRTEAVPFFQRSREKSGRYSQRPLQMVAGYLGFCPRYFTGLVCPQRQVIASPGRSTMFMVVSWAQLRSPAGGPSYTQLDAPHSSFARL